jgi:hypothetical protein
VYRKNEEGRKVLTHIPAGEPVPEFATMSPAGLQRAEQRGDVVVDWDAGDSLKQARQAAASARPNQEQEPGTIGETIVALQTSRGVTEHLSSDGGVSTRCGKKTKDYVVVPLGLHDGDVKICSRCASAGESAVA